MRPWHCAPAGPNTFSCSWRRRITAAPALDLDRTVNGREMPIQHIDNSLSKRPSVCRLPPA